MTAPHDAHTVNSPALSIKSGPSLAELWRDLANASTDFAGYDEFAANSVIRPKWQRLVEAVSGLPQNARDELWRRADAFVRDNGVTYNVFQDQGSEPRPWLIDLFPLVFDEAEWLTIQRGLKQRTSLLNAIVADIYGPQELLASGAIPPELVFGNPGYQRAFLDLPRNPDASIALCGYELARSPKGRWYVMADRFDVPLGAGYTLENRLAVSRTLPQAIQQAQVQRLAPFFARLRKSLRRMAVRNVDDPRVVILTGGPDQPGYFEDVFLARYLGFLLVEGGDLAVRDDNVFVKTVDGFLAVDVILNRVSELDIDPLEVTTGAPTGVVGLVNAVRNRRVVVANTLGVGLIESPVWMPFLRGLCLRVLGQELLLPSIATWWCGEEEERAVVLDRLDELVVKPAFEYSGGREVVVADLTEAERANLIREIEAAPHTFVAQERIVRSVSPTWKNSGFGLGHNAIRTFVTSKVTTDSDSDAPAEYRVMPGGLVRVGADSRPMPLTITAGQRSKDIWVLSESPVNHVSLLGDDSQAVVARRNSHLVPCRIADNLFWLGRTLETAEFDARLLRAVIERVESEQPTDQIEEFPALQRALIGCELLAPMTTVIQGDVDAIERATCDAVLSDAQQTTVRSSILELSRIAGNSRDRLSRDTWQAIRSLDELFSEQLLAGDADPSDCLDLLDDILRGLASTGGLISDGMVRGAAWRFCQIGRRIARAERVVRFLRHAWPLSGEPRGAVLESILDVSDGKITYRSRYLADIHPLLVLDLVMFDESNPRSLAFQLMELNEHVARLPKPPTAVRLTDVESLCLELLSSLRLANISDLVPERAAALSSADAEQMRQRFNQLLDQQLEKLKELSLAIVRTYLVLSRSAKQREDGIVRLS